MNDIDNVLKLFGLNGDRYTAEQIESGHINNTYKITWGGKSYILQRLNGTLFSSPEKIMENIALVCRYSSSPLRFLIHEGKNYVSYNGAVWRMYGYIPDSVSYDELTDFSMISEFGRILGQFHCDTCEIDPESLHITIEDFHNTKKRIEKLLELKKISDILRTRYERFLAYSDRLSEKCLTLKVTHNDVKCSNVLFDIHTKKALALIDLDTVMAGYYSYDIGDGIRSACAVNDCIDIERLKAFCGGYFSAYKDEYLSKEKAEEIFLGAVCVTAELSARYMFDAVSGENYFADKTEKQKAVRAERLLELAEDTAENENIIVKTISR